MQIALYGDLLAAAQGQAAEHGSLMLGTGDADKLFAIEQFRLGDFRHYVRRAVTRFEAFADDPPLALNPDPCGYCSKCAWLDVCENHWEQVDHLCRVAGIISRQRDRLISAGVATMTGLGRLCVERVSGIDADTLARLIGQARLQQMTLRSGEGQYELLEHQPGCGFDRLPAPDPGDLFFDFECDPMHPGGLEYLCEFYGKGRPGMRKANQFQIDRDCAFLRFGHTTATPRNKHLCD